MKTESDEKQVGIHWSYREVLDGKSGNIMAINLGVACVVALALYVVANEGMSSGTLLALLLKNLLSFKANLLAFNICGIIVLSIPTMMIFWPIIAGILWVFYNLRDRNVPRTDFNLAAHGHETKKVWIWSWSIIVGVFDFSALFSLLSLFVTFFGSGWAAEAKGLWEALTTIVSLIFAERRVTYVSRTMAGRRDGNLATVRAVLSGAADSMLPEDLRNDFGRARVATVIRIGIFSSPQWAAHVVHGISLRTKVKLWSGFLNSAIHGVLTAISFGIAATAANTIGAVSGEFCAGRQKQYVKSLRAPSPKKARFFIEGASVLCCIALIVALVMYIVATGDTSLLE